MIAGFEIIDFFTTMSSEKRSCRKQNESQLTTPKVDLSPLKVMLLYLAGLKWYYDPSFSKIWHWILTTTVPNWTGKRQVLMKIVRNRTIWKGVVFHQDNARSLVAIAGREKLVHCYSLADMFILISLHHALST